MLCDTKPIRPGVLATELRQALVEISEIRRQLARSERFRGYRALPVAVSSALGFAAAVLQDRWLPRPMDDLDRYLSLWLGVAVISLVMSLGDIAIRRLRAGGLLERELTQLALGQFLPCLLAGGLVTLIIAERAPDAAWMLPGLWAILFSLGLFASGRLLPRGIMVVAAYYLATGCICLWLGPSEQALAGWRMAVTFGVGQAVAAGVLFWTESE